MNSVKILRNLWPKSPKKLLKQEMNSFLTNDRQKKLTLSQNLLLFKR